MMPLVVYRAHARAEQVSPVVRDVIGVLEPGADDVGIRRNRIEVSPSPPCMSSCAEVSTGAGLMKLGCCLS